MIPIQISFMDFKTQFKAFKCELLDHEPLLNNDSLLKTMHF